MLKHTGVVPRTAGRPSRRREVVLLELLLLQLLLLLLELLVRLAAPAAPQGSPEREASGKNKPRA
jgi:hypothetical protein